ncbi:KGGVGR-motif variant AAA ATPase [Actinokineospora sp. 24-640]
MIATFYSYKGGVGRSFCLANVAVQLARWGNRVLCVDWDLEAPGLHTYFRPWLPAAPTSGVVELATAAKEGPVDWRDAVVPVPIDGIDGLRLMPAGRMDDSYVDRVQSISWPELYAEHNLGWRFELMAKEMRAEYDHVLIDSRTGITDIGGICTAQLPDVLVLCLTPNRQNLDGAMDVARRAAATRDHLPYDKAGLLVLPIVSRFDAREEYERARHWREEITRCSAGLYDTWLPQNVGKLSMIERTTIPYLPYWSFGEDLPAVTENSDNPEMVTHYLDNIAALLAHGLTDADVLASSRDTYVHTARDRLRTTELSPSDVYVHGSSRRAEEIRDALAAFGLRVAATSSVRAALLEARHVVVVDAERPQPGVVDLVEHFTLAQRESEVGRLLIPVVGDRSRPAAVLGHHQALVDRGGPAEEVAAGVLLALSRTVTDDRAHWASALVAAGYWMLDHDGAEAAGVIADEAAALMPADPVSLWLLQGRIAFETGDYLAAADVLASALDVVPMDAVERFPLLMLLGRSLWLVGDLPVAEELLSGALGIADGEQEVTARRVLAQVLVAMNRDGSARQMLETALDTAEEGSPAWLETAVDLSVLERRHGRMRRAEALLRSAARVPARPELRLLANQHLASVLEQQGSEAAMRMWATTAKLAAETGDIDAMAEAARNVMRLHGTGSMLWLAEMVHLVADVGSRAGERGRRDEAAELRELGGLLLMTAENHGEAAVEFTKAVAAYRALRDPAGIARGLARLAALDLRAGRDGDAAVRLAEVRSLLPELRGEQATTVRDLIADALR